MNDEGNVRAVLDTKREVVITLLPNELRNTLPRLYAQEHVQDTMAYMKFLTPDARGTWSVTQGEEDFRLFGFVIGLEEERGYFVPSQLESARRTLRLSIERDLYFTRQPLSEVRSG